VFDIVGKRRWFFALSLAITIPGLVFLLLGFVNPRYGLQFAIDFTGGTVWTIRFEDPNVNPDQVRDVLAGQGIEANVTQTGQGFMEIRTKEAALAAPLTPAPTPGASASPSGSPGASPAASPAASASAGASPSSSPAASPSASPSGSPAASGSASASPGASVAPSASAGAGPGGALPTQGKLGEARVALEAALGPIAEQQSLSSVGAVVSSDLITQALVLILVGSIGILLWITYRFRDVRMGTTALISLLHDVLVVVGVFAILGTFAGLQIDGLFVTAMLTVIGFSVHDTIVVFDRVRENRARHVGEPFERIVNHSILQTLGRSITTSLTVVITLLTLLLFAGEAIGTFVLALLLGIVSGTYSSIFNAAPLLVVWHNRDDRKRAAEHAARPSRRPAT
jgi:preprotein translocase SecF subunit